MRVPMIQKTPDRATVVQQLVGSGYYAVEPRISPVEDAPVTSSNQLIEGRNPRPMSMPFVAALPPPINDGALGQYRSATAKRLHRFEGRDWEEHHQGSNFGYIFGGVFTFVGLTLAGGYAYARWKRLRLLKLRVTNASELPSENSHRFVDLAPLLPNGEHRRPALAKATENIEGSELAIHTEEPSGHPPSLLTSGLAQPSGGEHNPLLLVNTLRIQELSDDRRRHNDEHALHNEPTQYEHWQPPVIQTQPHTPPPWNLRIPLTSVPPNEGTLPRHDDERIALHHEGHFQALGRLPFSEELELETPTISASDSDSMQVNIPWRDSSRFIPPRTESLPTQLSYPESPSDLIAPNERTYPESPQNLNSRNEWIHPESPPALISRDGPTSHPTLNYISSLHLRALEDEDRAASQSSSILSSANSPIKSGSIEDDRSIIPARSSAASSLSSLSRLRSRLMGSAPFLPLIEESSPLDTEKLFGHLNGVSSRRSSMNSKQSRRSQSKPVPAYPYLYPLAPTRSSSSPLSSRKSSSPSPLASRKSSSPSPLASNRPQSSSTFMSSPSTSALPSPSAFPLPPTLSHSFVPTSQTLPEPHTFIPITNEALSLPSSLQSYHRISSPRSFSSPLPISGSGESEIPPAPSIADHSSPAQLLETTTYHLPAAGRRLPIRPLPGLPPNEEPPLARRDAAMISTENQNNVVFVPLSHNPEVDNSPIRTSEETARQSTSKPQ